MNEQVMPLVVHVSEEVHCCGELLKEMKEGGEAKSNDCCDCCCCRCLCEEVEMLIQIGNHLFFDDGLVLFQTQFEGVHVVVVVVVDVVMKLGANVNEDERRQKRTTDGAGAGTTWIGTGTCSNLQCDHFRRKCDIEWKASKDR